MGKTLVAVDKNGAIAENTLCADSFLVLKDGQLDKIFKNDIDAMDPAQFGKICLKLDAETIVSGGYGDIVDATCPGIPYTSLVEMTAGTSPAWREEEYSRNKIDEMWQDIVNPLLESGGSIVVQPMPKGDAGQLDWQDGHIEFDAKPFSSQGTLLECWPSAEWAMNVVFQDKDDAIPGIIVYDLLWFDKEDYSGYKYIDRLAKLEKILKSSSSSMSLIGGKVLWPEASFDEFNEAVEWGFGQEDIAYVAVRDLGFQYEEPIYLKKSEGAWRIVAPPTRTLADVIAHPFKVLRELREE